MCRWDKVNDLKCVNGTHVSTWNVSALTPIESICNAIFFQIWVYFNNNENTILKPLQLHGVQPIMTVTVTFNALTLSEDEEQITEYILYQLQGVQPTMNKQLIGMFFSSSRLSVPRGYVKVSM